MKFLFFIITALLLFLNSCSNDISGEWKCKKVDYFYSIDTALHMDYIGLTTFFELTNEESYFFEKNKIFSSSNKSFIGTWEIEDNNRLILDIEWSKEKSESYASNGEYQMFEIIEANANNVELKFENRSGYSIVYLMSVPRSHTRNN